MAKPAVCVPAPPNACLAVFKFPPDAQDPVPTPTNSNLPLPEL